MFLRHSLKRWGKNVGRSAVAESRGKIECWAPVGFPYRRPAFDFFRLSQGRTLKRFEGLG
jgi:hypothetical protein